MRAVPQPLQARFNAAMARLDAPARLGIAVSGGGDSVALMHLAQRWGKAALSVATVDHGLRAEAEGEAAHVARAAQELGLRHATLRWTGWDGQGNLQDRARDARRALLGDWARHQGLDAVLLGHTRDDQAETLLMRLARGSGVDGLAAMAPVHHAQGLRWLRPLLEIGREELRDFLRAEELDWCEDPGNSDLRFDRIKARAALEALAPLGLTATRLSETAARMQQARAALEQSAAEAARALCREDHGDIVFDAKGFDALPDDIRLRLAAEALRQIASSPYRPRLRALRRALTLARTTLHGCVITRSQDTLRMTREFQAVRLTTSPCTALWDRRWRVTPPADGHWPEGLEVRALGPDGLALCPDRTLWRLPRLSLLASPALWRGTVLVSAPLAGFSPQWSLVPAKLRGVLAAAPHSH